MSSPAIGTLEKALAYHNDQIVYKFLERFDLPFEDAKALFEETKKWLWLCSLPDKPVLTVTQELLILDEMWHTFILFTGHYAAYCDKHLGHFIHHFPMTEAERERLSQQREEDPEKFLESREQRMREEFEFIADHLGPDTLFHWFVELPRRYGPAFFEHAARVTAPKLPPAMLDQLDDIADRFHGG